ncbi:MAG: LVIVD repeat-containing protein, partial [Candidatus Thorarchaeota archaeon SMTZ1-83]
MEPKGRRFFASAAIAMLVICIVVPVAWILLNQNQGLNLDLVKVGQIHTGGSTWDVEVRGEIAFVIDRNEPTPGGLVLINVSDRTDPKELSSFHDGGLPIALDVADDLVYVADTSDGLEIINVSDPKNPEEIGGYTGSGAVYDVQVVGDVAYVADWNSGLLILNVTDPTNPLYLSG